MLFEKVKHVTDANDATEVTDDENEMEEILEENEDEDPDWSGEALQEDEDDDEDDAEELDDNDDPEWGPKNEDIPGIHKFRAIFLDEHSKLIILEYRIRQRYLINVFVF